MNILIIDDEIITRSKVETLLSPYGQCHVYDKGILGFKAFTHFTKKEPFFSIVCIDIHMPDLNGLKLLQMIREHEKKVKLSGERQTFVIMLTADGSSGARHQAFELGCDAYIVKPFSDVDIDQALIEAGFNPENS